MTIYKADEIPVEIRSKIKIYGASGGQLGGVFEVDTDRRTMKCYVLDDVGKLQLDSEGRATWEEIECSFLRLEIES